MFSRVNRDVKLKRENKLEIEEGVASTLTRSLKLYYQTTAFNIPRFGDIFFNIFGEIVTKFVGRPKYKKTAMEYSKISSLQNGNPSPPSG